MKICAIICETKSEIFVSDFLFRYLVFYFGFRLNSLIILPKNFGSFIQIIFVMPHLHL